MKKILLILTTILFTLSANSQTLKVTGVDSNNDRLYQATAKKYLGKTMILTVYDNAIRLKVNNNEEILRQSSANYYSKIIKEDETNIETLSLEVNTTMSVITSAIFRITIQEKAGQRRRAVSTITAKRF